LLISVSWSSATINSAESKAHNTNGFLIHSKEDTSIDVKYNSMLLLKIVELNR
jgi:hypothetical protein